MSNRVRTYRPKHCDTSLSREWRMNMANKKKYLAESQILGYLFISLAAIIPGPSNILAAKGFRPYK